MGQNVAYSDIPEGFQVAGTQQAPQYSDIPQGFQIGGQKSSPDYAGDMIKSGGAALAKGVVNASIDPVGFYLSLPRAVAEGVTRPLGAGYEALAEHSGGVLPELSTSAAERFTYPLGGNPDSDYEQSKAAIVNGLLAGGIKEGTGANIDYHPQTKPGEYAASVGGALPYMAQGLPPVNAVTMGLGSQGGKDLASLFTDNPKYQQAASIVGGGLGGLAGSPVADNVGKLMKDENTSYIGGLGLPKGSVADYLPSYTPEQIKAAAVQAYKNSEAMGGQIPINEMRQTVQQLLSNKDIGQQTARGQAFAGQSPVTDTLAKLQDAVKDNAPWTTADANEIHDSISNDIQKARRAGDYDSARSLTIIKNALRDKYNTYAEANPQQAAGFNEWLRGDKLYSAASKGEEIQDIINNAEKADVPSTAIKNGFKTFVKDSDNKAGLTDKEWEAANYAATHGIITSALKNMGSRLGGHVAGTIGGAALGSAGGPITGAIGALAGDAAGQAITAPFRAMANARQAARGQTVNDLISQRPVVQEALNANYKPPIPSAPPSSIIQNIPAMGAELGNIAQQPQNNKTPVNPLSDENLQKLQGLKTQLQNQPKPQSNASDFFPKMARAENNTGNPNAKNPNSSASGAFQFTDGTWNQMVKRYGAETGIGIQDKNDPKAQEVMAKLYAKDNVNRMEPFLKRLPTKGELYQAHVLGADGALRLINAANSTPDKQAIMLYPKAVTAANHSLFFNGNAPRTALELYQLLNKKVAI